MTSTRPIRCAGVALILAVGAIHAYEAPDYLSAKAYVGVLFILAAAGSLAVALGLLRTHDARAWTLGALIAAGCFAGFILARTTGLPGFKESGVDTIGVISLIVEAAFVATALAARGGARSLAERRPAARRPASARRGTGGSYA